jgi:hypothetical protein
MSQRSDVTEIDCLAWPIQVGMEPGDAFWKQHEIEE